jgi:hypothetical protein
VRELADYDPGRYAQILRYPAGEALMAYEHRLRQQTRQDYDRAVQIWATLAATGATKSKRPPELPAILKDRS